MTKTPKFPVTEAKNLDLQMRMAALGLREDDFNESYFKTIRSGGKSGLLGVTLHHSASGLHIRCQRERSQGINRFLARRTLVEELEKRRHRSEEAPRLEQTKAALPPQTLLLPTAPSFWGLDAPSEPGKESSGQNSSTHRQ